MARTMPSPKTGYTHALMPGMEDLLDPAKSAAAAKQDSCREGLQA